MDITFFLLLFLKLKIINCASNTDQNENFQVENHASRDIFSRHLNEQLLHKVLEYDAKSTGRMAKANRALQKLAVVTRTFRYFEGAGWDMPELANICEFGLADTIDRPQLETELAKIMALSHIKDEASFNETLETLLFKYKFFKELAGPVLKYLIRRYYVKLQKGIVSDTDGAIRQKYLFFAVENRLYDVFLELGKDASVWNGKNYLDVHIGQIHDCFYFDCYNSYAYNLLSARKFIGKKMAEVEPEDYGFYDKIIPGEAKLSRSEFYAWAAVCIYRRAPEKEFVLFLIKLPETFLDIIKNYIYKYSPITFDDNEKEHSHRYIVTLLDKYFGYDKSFASNVKFIRLLNDVRFGNVNDSVYHDRILNFDEIDRHLKLETLIMATSKANNKLLVKQLAKHPYFLKQSLDLMAHLKCPHCFKVYFDMIESAPLQDVNGNFNYAEDRLILAILKNKFKITKTITTSFGVKFGIQSPTEYIKLGFASNYEILLEINVFSAFRFSFVLVEKMLNDAAEAGAKEFIQLINEHCGDHIIEPNFIHLHSFKVSYEVIQMLIEHQELIGMLANRCVELICRDERINPEEIANFRQVINPL